MRDQVFITSNRDEKNSRAIALTPEKRLHRGTALVFPGDPSGGGTWIAMKENGDAAVLLNGGFDAHVAKPPYRKSRGLVFLDIIASESPNSTADTIDLSGIEPFTLVLFEKQQLVEFRWDGVRGHGRSLPVNEAHIWSSATLYSADAAREREKWLQSFLRQTKSPTQQDIWRFHRHAGTEDRRNSLVMERDGIYRTVSITGLELNANRGVMTYADLRREQTSTIKLELIADEPSLV